MIPYIHLGPITLGTFGLMMWLAFVVAFFAWRADLQRRNIAADSQLMIGVIALAGIVGAKLWHILERPNELIAAPTEVIFSRTGFAWFGGFIAGMSAFIYFARKYR